MADEDLQCPLVTPYTNRKEIDPATLERLFQVRKWDIERDDAGVIHNPIPFKWPKSLRTTIWDIDRDCDSGVPLILRQYQIQMIHHLVRMSKFICGDAVGLGKAQPLNAKVLTPSGWKTMGDMTIGQEVIDPDGGTAFVEGVYPQGEVDIYRVELNDGSITECCGGHLWTVQTPDDRMRGVQRTLTTLQLLERGLTRTRGNGDTTSSFFTPVAVPTVWGKPFDLPLPPYTLGALLGDGGIKYRVTITSADLDVIQQIRAELPEGLGLRQCDDRITWHISKGRVPGRGIYNPYITALRSLGLFGCGSGNKFIPDGYLRSSVSARMELLRGLMDTDGECSKAGLCYFSTISHKLAFDVAELVRSLGGIAKVRDRKPKWYTHKGEKRQGQPGYTVTVKMHLAPFNLQRKSERWKMPQFARAIHSITPVGTQPAQCIKVSSKRHLYITDDYIVTHNTLDVVAAAAWIKERVPDSKVVIVTTKSTAQPLDSLVLTPTGWKPMGSLSVGATLIDPDGGFSYVLGVHPQGEKDVYQVTTTDGEVAECCIDHLWEVQTLHLRRLGKFKTVSLKDIVEHGVTYRSSGSTEGYSYRLPLTAPIEFSSLGTIPIPAYTLGVLLGDGSLRHGAIFYAEENDIVSRISSELPGYTLSERSKGQYAIVQSHNGGVNGVMDALREIGAFGYKSPDKRIPEIYLRASVINRIELLRGLMDSDGSISHSGQCTFHTTSTQLRDGVVSLVRSLGGIASIQPTPQPPKKSKLRVRGVVKDIVPSHPKWVVTIQTQFNPFHLTRKAARWVCPKLCRSIKNVELVGRKQVQCISTSAKRGLYVTDGHIVTHNTYQWRDEFLRFSLLRPFVMKDKYRGMKSSEARFAQMTDFLNGTKKDVLIVKYDSIKGTRKKIEGKVDADGNPVNGKEKTTDEMRFYSKVFKENKDRLILVFDECHKFKGTQTAVRNLVFGISRSAAKVWGLTATVMKNSLNEFYAITSALGICPFGFMPEFSEEFCIHRPQYIGGGRKKLVLVGYKNVSKFKEGIRPFFLGRSQRQVKEPLPQLSTMFHALDLSDEQIDLLDDIQNGEFILPPALVKVDGELYERERDPDNLMTKLSVQQLVANHPALLDPTDTKKFYTNHLSPKEEALLDMLDGDLLGEKVIVFTKYKMWIDRLEKITKNGHFTHRKFLRITGNENEKTRNDNKRKFQSSDDHDLIVINSAGIEGINLQQAAHMVCMDLPWSWGDLIQLVGRMVRMASPHSACTLHVLVAKGTVDEYAIETLKGKKGVFEKILGESHSAGILDDNTFLDLDSGMEGGSDDEYKSLLKAHVKSVGMKTFLDGDRIDAARGNEDYKMVFQKGKKSGTKKKASALPDTDKGKWGDITELV